VASAPNRASFVTGAISESASVTSTCVSAAEFTGAGGARMTKRSFGFGFEHPQTDGRIYRRKRAPFFRDADTDIVGNSVSEIRRLKEKADKNPDVPVPRDRKVRIRGNKMTINGRKYRIMAVTN